METLFITKFMDISNKIYEICLFQSHKFGFSHGYLAGLDKSNL